MARPKKQKELKRNHHIMLRLNDTEYDIVTENAQTANLPVAEYARKQVMNQRITMKYEVVADVPELKKLISEFGKIGSNLNQIAKYFNTGGMRSLAIEDEIHQCIEDLFKLRKKVLEMAGDTDGSS